MPILAPSASDVTASVKAGAEVNAAIGGAVSRGGNSAPPRAGGSAAASATVTQSRAAQTSSTPVATVFRIPPIVLPVAWTPAVLSTVVMWLDGNDPLATGVQLSAGTVISSWKDKSGNARHATATGSPVSVASSEKTTLYGVQIRDNPNPKSSFSIPFAAGFFNASIGFLYVYRGRSTTNYGATVTRGGTFEQYGGLRTIPGSTGASSTWAHTFVAPNGPVNNTSILTQVVKPIADQPGKWRLEEYANGVDRIQSGPLFPFANPFGDISTVPMMIGNRNDNVTGFEGDIYELIVFNTVISTEQRQLMEGYLAWKWGLVSKLPANHPYKAYSPMV